MIKAQKLSDLINTGLTDVQCIETRSPSGLLNDNTEKEKQALKPLAGVSMDLLFYNHGDLNIVILLF